MFVYKREVTFVNLYMNGIKCGNIGVLKQQLTADSLYLCLELCGMERWKTTAFPVYLTGKESKKSCGNIGSGGAGLHMEADISVEELRKNRYDRLFIHPAENCYAVAELLKPEYEEAKAEMGVASDARADDTDSDEEVIKEAEEVSEVLSESEKEAVELQESVYEDKWEQIKKKYPIIYPFQGQGAYVSIMPVDLQLLKEPYQDLNNNTFLMHSFYRYRHMILGEYSSEKGIFFYVGVPGEFVKKEQSTAALCGFEGYEHSGDLGYYLYRVEL